MANDSNSAGGVFMAFALGAIAGAAVALLYAPGPGEETRRRIAERAREGRDFLNRQREHLSTAVERGREAFDQARKESL